MRMYGVHSGLLCTVDMCKGNKEMKTFIINVLILFYFPRGCEMAYNKMHRQNKDGNRLKIVKGLTQSKRDRPKSEFPTGNNT